MNFGLFETWLALPPALGWALGLAPLAPLVGWPAWVRWIGRRPPTIALQLAGRAALLVAFALALLTLVATLTTARTGLQALVAPATDAALARQQESESAWASGDSNRLNALVTRHVTEGRVALAALSGFPCQDPCLLAAAGVEPGPALQALAAQAAALPPNRSVSLARPDHRTMVIARAPLRDDDGRTRSLLLIGVAATDVMANTQRLAWQLAAATLLLSVAALFITRAVVARTLSQRVQDLIAHIGSEPSAASPGDELEQLSGGVSQLVRRSVALETQLQQVQKMEAVGRLTGGIAHDFNNLLTVIRANTSLLRGESDREELDDIDRAAQRGAALVRRLMAFGRQGPLELAPHTVGPLLHEFFATLRRLLPDTVRLELPPKIPGGAIDVDRTAFDQVVLNLVTNARDAMPTGGILTVAVATARPPADFATANGLDPTRTYLTIAIGDSGSGMAPDVAARAFEPFFTTKAPDQGTGLGLAIVYGLMRRHGGAVHLETAPDRGTTQTLWFPHHAVPDPTMTPVSGVAAAPTGTRTGHLLVIEDEEMVRRTTEMTLKRMGYSVTTAENGKEGLRLLEGPVPFLAAISDVQMPVMGGLEFVRLARSRGHRIPILLVSGYSLEDVDDVIARHPGVASLGKPWSAADLARALERLLVPNGS